MSGAKSASTIRCCPRFLEEIRIRNLALDGASVDLRLRRHGEGTEVAILSQRGDLSIRIAQ